MDNLAKVVNAHYSPGQVQPCIKTNRGVDIASRVSGATFAFRIALAYKSGGVAKRFERVIPVSESIVETAPTDPRSIILDAPIDVSEFGNPDPGTVLTAMVSVQITDASGGIVSCCPVEVTSLNVPLSSIPR
jgi:hypothetical protein